jgi:N-acetylneuraminic acid mutarotase
MRKSAALLLALVFLTASCIAVKPSISSTDVTEDTWVSKASMQVARSNLGVAAVNGKIYAIGGSTENGVVGTNEEYDLATDTWTYKKPMPTPRYDFGIAVYQNKIYCIGGFSAGGYYSNESIKGVNEVYDPATDTWETKEPIPNPRRGLGANVVNGKIYLTGGFVPDSSSSTGFSILSLNEVYDPETDSWTTKAEVPTAVSSVTSAVVDSRIYLIMSGLNQIYDAATDTWSLGTPLPHSSIGVARAVGTTGVNAPKRIYVFGGGETQVYDPESDSWTFGADMLTKRSGFGVAVLNDILYVIGGFTETFDMFWNSNVTLYATNEQYTPFGYGTVPPEIAVVSPENKTYTSSNASLAFTVNKPALWMGYSLDGQDNVTITSNTTLSGLTNGSHNITVHAKDEFENTGASETVTFTIAKETETFPIRLAVVAAVVVAAVVLLAAVGVGLSAYLKKRK